MTEGEARTAFSAAGIENAAQEAHWLAAAWAGDIPADAVRRRVAHEPLPYILGEWEFCREHYEVNPCCLIPRADTERLVEEAARRLPQGARFLDLCTGSGCVAVSLAAMRPDLAGVGIDLFPETLATAARNAARNGVSGRVHFLRADVLADPPAALAHPGGYPAILANPPYIRADLLPTLAPEVRREPRAALCGGADGLDFYRAILTRWRRLLAPDGLFLFEIGYDQADALRALSAEHGFSCTVLRDYGGRDRVTVLRPVSD